MYFTNASLFQETAWVSRKKSDLVGIDLILSPRSFGGRMIDGAVHFQKRRGFRQANNNLVENIQFSRKGVLQGGFRDKIGPLSSNQFFSK